MTRSEFITYYAKRLNISEREAEKIILIIIARITKSLKKNKRIEIRGFGSFYNKFYKAYQGSDPRTKEPFEVKAKHAPVFKTSKKWLEELNS